MLLLGGATAAGLLVIVLVNSPMSPANGPTMSKRSAPSASSPAAGRAAGGGGQSFPAGGVPAAAPRFESKSPRMFDDKESPQAQRGSSTLQPPAQEMQKVAEP